MASIRPVVRKNGTVAHKVLWREDGVQTSQTFDDPFEANRLKKFLDANGGRYRLAQEAAMAAAAKGPTVADAVEAHLSTLSGVSVRTPADYANIARLHIIPQLGARRVNELTRRDVANWVNGLQAGGASPKSIANWHGLLSSVMATAVEDGYAKANPCRGVRLPRRLKRRDDRELILVPEWLRLREEFPPQWQLLFDVLAGTGMRWGEAIALRVDALGDHVLHIREAYKRDGNNRFYVGEPKSAASVRDVDIDSNLYWALEAAAAGRPGSELLLVSPRGGKISYQYVQARVWTPAMLRAVEAGKLRWPHKIHDIRHSHGAWLVEAGEDLVTVQRRLGHESIKTTIDVYGHISDETRKRAAKVVGDLLNP